MEPGPAVSGVGGECGYVNYSLHGFRRPRCSWGDAGRELRSIRLRLPVSRRWPHDSPVDLQMGDYVPTRAPTGEGTTPSSVGVRLAPRPPRQQRPPARGRRPLLSMASISSQWAGSSCLRSRRPSNSPCCKRSKNTCAASACQPERARLSSVPNEKTPPDVGGACAYMATTGLEPMTKGL